jgi:[protein-PII] uridylyltransferase
MVRRLLSHASVSPHATHPLSGIFDHAAARISTVPAAVARGEQVEALRRYLRVETERLRIRHRVGLSGDDVSASRSQQVDLAVNRVCQLAADEFGTKAQRELAGIAVVALGGYGRAELAPFSDVDLLFLRPEAGGAIVGDFVERVLALLWDTGFSVGHSYRTLSECVAIAREDLHSRTALAEARLVTGDAALLARLRDRLHEAVFGNAKETEAFMAALRFETEARLDRYGRAVGLLEPNVKESAGGLRDLHTLLWLAHARFGVARLESLREAAALSEREYVTLRRARAFISRVRNEAHFCAGRKADQLTLELQPEVAANLGYADGRGMSASERLMHDYYPHARDMHEAFESFAVRNGLYGRRRRSLLRLGSGRGKGPAELHDGLVYLSKAGREMAGDPLATLALFDWAQKRAAGLASETKVALREGARAVGGASRVSREASRVFFGLLGRRGMVGATLRAMHETGFLGRYLPEFGRVTFRVQHDRYHRYTVDEHTLRAIEALDEVARAKANDSELGALRSVLSEIPDAAPLYLALLLHDTGKGRRGGSHVPIGARLAERVCARLHLARADAESVVALVRLHLEMSHISQRRDLSEEGLIRTFAAKVGDARRLGELLLLTYADHCAVGPGIWNGWKATLLWELYERALKALSPGGSVPRAHDARARARLRILDALSEQFAGSEVERHLAMLPERYVRSFGSSAVATHLRLIGALGGAPLVVAWTGEEQQGHSEITVCTRDAGGLLARLAGMLSAHNLDILAVDVYTREDGVVLDTFRVCEAPGCRAVSAERRLRVETALREAVEGRRDVASAVREWQSDQRRRVAASRARARPRTAVAVRFDDETSPANTIVEIGAEDELGLVYRIASVLSRVGLSIVFAKIASDKSRAWDVFYVTDAQGGKLTAVRKDEVRAALLAELSVPRPR